MDRINIKHRISYDLLGLSGGDKLESVIREEMVRKLGLEINKTGKYGKEVVDLEESNCVEYGMEVYCYTYEELIELKAMLKSMAACNPMFKDKCKLIWNRLIGE